MTLRTLLRFNIKFLVTAYLAFITVWSVTAQNQFEIKLQTGHFLPEPSSTIPPALPDELVGGRFVRMVQFFEIPNHRQRIDLEQKGWQFLRYLDGNAYLVSLPEDCDLHPATVPEIRYVGRYEGVQKVHPQVLEPSLPDWAIEAEGRILINVIGFEGTTTQKALLDLERIGILLKNAYKHYPRFKGAAEVEQIHQLAALPWVEWIELTTPPSTPDDEPARALHRSNMLDGALSSALHFTGAGVRTLVRDDGRLPVHPDFKGRVVDLGNDDDFFFGGGTHGDQVAGVMGGAGNIDPKYRGMATGTMLYNVNYEAEFTDTTLDLHINDNVVITNSSYSNGCTSGYNFGAFNVDLQLSNYPSLMHVFSAGNSNGSNCGYGAGNQWANITGGHKIAKNCIAVANLYADGMLVNSSSRGPCLDGRLKPDLAANGQDQVTAYPENDYALFGGTSAAAPGVAGVMAQLYEAYRSLHNQNDPPAALIKALLLNTAVDLGNPGPDYLYGWGHVNGWQAWIDLEGNRYVESQVDHQDIWTQEIVIPENISSARVMLYWPDVPAFVGAEDALVNDLDLTVVGPDTALYRPLVLRIEPIPNLLNSPAEPGRDSLNNAEQVVLEFPMPGTYTVAVSGYSVPTGPQPFFLTWHLETDQEITLTRPHGGESFVPGDDLEYIHWETSGLSGDFELEFSSDSGATWNAIATVPGDARLWPWTVPEVSTGQALIRISRNGITAQSSAPFSIAEAPVGLTPIMVCPDSIIWSWNTVDNATGYEFFKLGVTHMEGEGTTTDTLFSTAASFPYLPGQADWVAVKTLGNDQLASLRSVAVPFSENDLFQCSNARDLSVKGFVKPSNSNLSLCEPLHEGLVMLLVNTGNTPASSFFLSYQLNEEDVVSELVTDTILPNDTLLFQFATQESITAGEDSTIRGWISWTDDEFAYNDTIPLLRFSPFLYGPAALTPFSEQFSEADQQLPDQWRVLNPDSLLGWAPRTVTQSNGQSGIVMFVDNYAYSTAENEEDYLYSPNIQLPENGDCRLAFDYAYTYYNDNFWDAFRVELSTDCGNSFPHLLFEAEKDTLATTPPIQGSFSPQKDDWKQIVSDISQFAGQDVVVRFVNISGYGNQMYLDNINVAALSQPQALVTPISAPACAQVPVLLQDQSIGNFLTWQWLLPSGVSVPSETPDQDGYWTLFCQAAGNYQLSLIVTNPLGSDTTTFQIEVLPQPAPAFDYSIDGLGVVFINSSENATSYLWQFGDGQESELSDPVHEYAAPGIYTVTLSAVNTCGERQTSSEIETVTDIRQYAVNKMEMSVAPNPASHFARVTISGWMENTDPVFELTNQTGKLCQLHVQSVSQETTVRNFEADITHLPSGIYNLTVTTPSGRMTQQMVIVK